MAPWRNRHDMSLRPILIRLRCEIRVTRIYHISRPIPPQLLRMVWRIAVQRFYPLDRLVTGSRNRPPDKMREDPRHDFRRRGLRHALVGCVADCYPFDSLVVLSPREQRGEQVGYVFPVHERGETTAGSKGSASPGADVHYEVGICLEEGLFGRIAEAGDGGAVCGF